MFLFKRIRARQADFSPLPQQPKISIILVTWNTGGRFIEACLNSLRALDYQNFEVIIVDNASQDETVDVLKDLQQNEILILNKTNRGFGGGCNDGYKKSSGEIAVFLNYDTVVESNWLSELIEPMQEDNRVAITGCKMYYPDSKKIQHAGAVLHDNGMCEHIGYLQQDEGQHDETIEVDWVTGACLATRREFLEQCDDGFDEDFFPAYYEDTDLCYRARLMEYKVIFAHKAILQHFESPVIDNYSSQFFRLCNRGRIIFCLKNFTLNHLLFKWLPFEFKWLRAPHSKGHRKKQLRAYWDGIMFLFGGRMKPEQAKQK